MIDVKNRREISGFTMAEMLIVVAIIAVLGGVGFVAVQNYQRSMAQLECDTIAKEIFVAAQNHLTTAESQGYLGLDSTSYGNEGTLSDDQDIFNRQQVYYFTVNGSSSFRDNPLLNMMLPFGSIDETVRLGGNYIIRYQPQMARILDVFYTDPKGRYPHILVDGEDEYKKVMGYRKTNKTQRQRCADLSNATLGWFGGEDPLPSGDYSIEVPEIEVQNAERLTVTVTDKNYGKSGAVLKLIVTSKDAHTDPLVVNSGYAKAAFLLDPISHSERVSSPDDNGKYTIVLDDITTEGAHFSELNDITETTVDLTGKFIPGEDIIVQAVAYNKDSLSNIAYSNSWTVNSLFAEISQKTPEQLYSNASVIPGADAPWITAIINNFRHLENLDAAISNMGLSDLAYAWQINDLVWNGTEGFTGKIQKATNVSAVSVYNADNTERSTNDCFAPVIPSVMNESPEPIAFTYDGRGIKQINESEPPEVETISHSITGIKVNTTGSAGLFGNYGLSEAGQSNIAYLELVDFEITSTGHAGALAGILNNTTVSNVLAYHNNDSEQTTITSSNGDAGGLVGDMNGGQIEQCAAALYVRGKANAGGLVGKAENAAITASYSGGHTDGTANYDKDNYNVTASDGIAGGLVGVASGNTKMINSYSTCSAKGEKEDGSSVSGGFIGAIEGANVSASYCYASGLVASGENAGTFVGKVNGTFSAPHCYYVSGINGILGSGCDAKVLPSVGATGDLVTLEKSADFRSVPYDSALLEDDNETGLSYSYLTIRQICNVNDAGADGKIVLADSDFLSNHYGDWQEPVTLETDLELINAERLTAKVSFPVAKLDEGQMLTMLIHGTKDARLLFALEKRLSGDTVYQLTLREASGIADKNIRGENLTLDKWLEIALDDVSLDDGNIMFSIVLDDITTSNGHFSELFPEFLPGEDITVAVLDNEATLDEMKALAENNGKWMEKNDDGNVIRVLADRTNSLFASVSSGTTASIGNFRHLENLDKTISGLGQNSDETKKVEITTAVQNGNLDWNGTWQNSTNKWNEFTIYKMDATAEPTDKKGFFLPVSPDYHLDYQGNSKAISNLVVNNGGHAGLFGSMVAGSSVSNLELIDFSVIGTGNAGALAGTLAGTSVTNVLAHNSTEATTVNVSATSGDAGGLIGSMIGGSVNKSAAALIVSAGDDTHVGNAGGLIGTISGEASVSASYSGGHTVNGAYTADYNVTATSTAGGLIGVAGNANISNSYSTCSAKGATVGGFVGTSSGNITNCYATGLVSGTTKGAFAGEYSTGTAKDCLYYEIINVDLFALADAAKEGIAALDATVETYNAFVGSPTDWQSASAYDKTALDSLFGENKYSLKTVAQLGATVVDTDFVATHYGDWPAPEMLVINK